MKTVTIKAPRSLMQGMEAAFGVHGAALVVARMQEIEFLKIDCSVVKDYEVGARREAIIRNILLHHGEFECPFTGETYHHNTSSLHHRHVQITQIILKVCVNELQYLKWVHSEFFKRSLLNGESYKEKQARREERSKRLLDRTIALNVSNRLRLNPNERDARGAQFDTVYQGDDNFSVNTEEHHNSDSVIGRLFGKLMTAPRPLIIVDGTHVRIREPGN